MLILERFARCAGVAEVPEDVTALLEFLPLGVVRLDRQDAIVAMNARARALVQRLLGESPGDPAVNPASAAELVDLLGDRSGDIERARTWYGRCGHGAEESLQFEFGGSLAYRLTHARPKGEGGGWLVLQDVSAEAKQARLLEELESLMRGGGWEMDIETGELVLSDGVWALFGSQARDRLVDLESWLAYVEEDQRESLKTYIERCIRDGIPYEATYPIHLPDGRRMVVSAQGRVVSGEHGRRGIGIFRDVTVEHEQQQALRDSEERLRTILDTVADIVILQRHEQLEFVSASVQDVLGYEPRSLIGQNALAFVHPDEAEEVASRFRDFDHERARVLSMECRLRHADGSWRTMQLAARRSAGTGEAPPLVIACRDVTELREAQERLRQGEKLEALGRLAGGVAHDFNNLLTTIIGNCELIDTDVAAGSDVAREVHQIHDAGMRAADLTRQLLTFARRSEPVHEPVNVNDTVAEAVSLLQRSLDRRFSVHLHLSEEPLWVEGEGGSIHAALLNLGLNARDAMARTGGVIEISTVRVAGADDLPAGERPAGTGPFVVIEVADTGEGIDPVLLQRIFEPCFTTKPVGHGTGLGLSTVQGCVLSHGGVVQVESERGRGSRFRMVLPSSAAPPRAEPATDASRGAGRRHVVVIDDQIDVQTVIAAALERVGVVTTRFADGASALRWLGDDHEPVDLVLLDMSMPGLSGAQTFDALRRIDPGLPVLVTSGYSFADAPEDLIKRGAVGFLGKPFRIAELVEAVRRSLGD